MRTLKFIVSGQTITLDPECDLNTLVPGTNEQVRARFVFSHEWDRRVKVAAFYSNLGTEYEPQALKNGELCEIPPEALRKSIFKVKVFGSQAGRTISTNKVTVYQKGGSA